MRSRWDAVFLSMLMTGSAYAAESTPSSTISFQLIGRLPTVQATTSGKTLPLILDLGAFAAVALTTEALNSTPVKFDGRSLEWRDASGYTFKARTFQVDDLSIGHFSAGSTSGAEFRYPDGDASHAQVGYVGFGLLSHFLLVFDYQKDELRLYPPGDSADMAAECGKHHFPIDVIDGVVESKFNTEHGQLIFQWDTGSAKDLIRPSVVGMKKGDYRDGQSYPFSRFETGGTDFGRTRISLREFVAPDVDGVLGTDFFEGKVVCFDPTNRIAAVRPAGTD